MSHATEHIFDYDAIPIGYYDEIFQRRKGMQSKWHHLKFDRVRREIESDSCHLDVACGPGTFVGTLDSSVSSVGVDIAPAQIEYANGRYAAPHREFRTMEPGMLPFDNSRFQVATLVELIEHITREESCRLLTECRRVLRPGGKIVVTTPNYAGLWPLLESLLNRFGRVSYQDQHITKYRAVSLRKLLTDCGFESVYVETFLLAAPFAAIINWRFADVVARCEPRFITRNVGHLLIGVGTTP